MTETKVPTFNSASAAGPLRGNRVVLTTHPSLPVYPISGQFLSRLVCLKRANNGSRAYSIISSQRASIFLRWSFGQPGSPQSFFFVSQKVFALPRAPHVLESGNT
jgi:hypothetical protein